MTDYIRREDALKALSRSFVVSDDLYGMGVQAGLKYARCKVEQIPAADVAEVVHGEWQGEGDGYADGEIVFDVWHCSECGYCIDDGTDDPERLPNYCPSCGAKMDGGNDNVSN